METSKRPNEETLSETFVKAWKLFQEIEKSDDPVASEDYQAKVKSCITQFVRCTFMVNILGLFSFNEEIDEVSTGNLRFILLPAFLGDLELKLTSGKDRKTIVENAFIYFRDYLKRCRDYKITKKNLDSYIDEKKDTSTNKPPTSQSREEKIAAYNEKRN